MTINEELDKLEDDIRRLKIEYEVYFNANSERPPRDLVYRVESYIKRRSADQSDLNFGERYKLNALSQKYAVQNALWRRRLMEREEGRGQYAQQKRGLEALTAGNRVSLVFSDPAAEPEKVKQMLKAIIDVQRNAGHKMQKVDLTRFQKFLCEEMDQIKSLIECTSVQFSVSTEAGKLKFTAVKA